MLSTQTPAKEVSIRMSTADARLIVAALYCAQTVDTLGLSNDQANRCGVIISAFHGAIFRALRRSRDADIS